MSTPADIVLLDGAMGTELARRGFELTGPLFAARALLDAPELVVSIHGQYIRAGAQIITTNSIGLAIGGLARAGLASRSAEMVELAVGCVEEARRGAAQADASREHGWGKVRIAGSLPPLGRTQPRDLAVAEQRQLASRLVAAGVDLLLLETYTSTAEVALALEAVSGFDIPVWLGVVAGAGSGPRPDGSRLLSGEPFGPIVELAKSASVGALLLNCTQIDAVPAALRALTSTSPPMALGLYPHLGRRAWDGTWIERFIEPDVFVGQMSAWLSAWPAFEIAGACCGSTPEYIRALADRLQPDLEARERSFVRLASLIP